MLNKNVFFGYDYERTKLEKIVIYMKIINKRAKPKRDTTLPWIPGLSQKLRKSFNKVVCNISFKSLRNLNTISRNTNKPKLPPNSQPGIYFIPTGCKNGYTCETNKQVRTRNTEHEKPVFKGDIEAVVLAEHRQTCNCDIKLKHTKTLAIEPVLFRHKVREALERRLKTGPNDTNTLNRDYGDYITTNKWQPLLDKIYLNKKFNIDTL